MTNNKSWYKKWWGVILAIIIWPLFLLWFLWRKDNKTNLILKTTGSLGVFVLVIILAAVISNPKTKASNTATKPDINKPATSLASLNAEVASILTPVLNDFSQQMSQGQSYATQPDAANASSAFAQWKNNETDKQNVTNNNEEHNTYNKADNMYFSAHQTAPASLSDWDSNAGSLPGDISTWANDEWLVLVDQLIKNDPSKDQANANNDLQTYQGDLAKAQADIKQLQ